MSKNSDKKAKNKSAKQAELAKQKMPSPKLVKRLNKIIKKHGSAFDDLLADVKNLSTLWVTPAAEALRWHPGDQIRKMDFTATPGFVGDKKHALALVRAVEPELDDLQERLYAEGKHDGHRSVLLVIQGLDTAGKGGIVRHVVGLFDPQGIRHHSFGVPTEEEAQNGYLWRIRNALPKPGLITVFDRSHYEQVLIVRVNEMEDEATWQAHYDEINEFEAAAVANGTKIVKVAMMVSPEEQKNRLNARLDREDKLWKFNPRDLDTRANFDKYLTAYQDMLDKTNTDIAPWYVIPCDNKWFAQLAVTELLLSALQSMDLQWPDAEFDIEEQRRRLAGM